MSKGPIDKGRGRPPKDPALVLRDWYWGLTLQRELPHGESLASLERKLFPHLTVRSRPHGEGNSQPFALTKVAQGKRGICADRSVPDVVTKATSFCPGSLPAYRSVLWSALCEPTPDTDLCVEADQIDPNVRERFGPRHFSPFAQGGWLLSESGVRRASRIAHRDTLGLLLLNCPPRVTLQRASLYAKDHVVGALLRACRADPHLQAIKTPLAALIAARIKKEFDPNDMSAARVFRVRRVSGMSVAIAGLLGE
jgi:hypothetical protein